MNVQIVADANLNILDIYTGHPGSVHDARVFQESDLGSTLDHPRWTPNMICPGDSYLIGDAAYPLLPMLITPFKNIGPNVPNREQFNFLHSSSRMVVERTIGLLKGRNRRLMYGIDIVELSEIEDVIFSACTIHQMALRCDDEADLNELFNDIENTHLNMDENSSMI